jgi:hypothetical protein
MMVSRNRAGELLLLRAESGDPEWHDISVR